MPPAVKPPLDDENSVLATTPLPKIRTAPNVPNVAVSLFGASSRAPFFPAPPYT